MRYYRIAFFQGYPKDIDIVEDFMVRFAKMLFLIAFFADTLSG
jgi:hypothetical protein